MSRPLMTLLLTLTAMPVLAATPGQLLDSLVADAARDGTRVVPSATRGEAFFATRHAEWSCTSCHTADPRQDGRHVVTGKGIRPMAPAMEPARLTDRARTDKWFLRNCRDVVGRPCTLAEQADVVAYLISLK